jgi:5-methylcytosine-specific restriction endonuclease McrA
MVENRRGEQSNAWKGGHRWDYGPSWPTQRMKAMHRDDYKCVVCGMTNREHMNQNNQELHVHHIVRKEAFRRDDGTFDHESANEIDNLVTLCRDHHNASERGEIRVR